MNKPHTKWETPKEFLARHEGRFGRTKLYDWIRSGVIPSVRLSSKKILVPADALDRLLDKVGP